MTTGGRIRTPEKSHCRWKRRKVSAKEIVRRAADIFKRLTPVISTAHIASCGRRSVGGAVMIYVIAK